MINGGKVVLALKALTARCAFSQAIGFAFALNNDVGGGECCTVFIVVALFDKFFQLLKCGTEHFNIVFEFGLYAFNEFGKFFVERVGFVNRVSPTNRNARDAAKEAPRRALAVSENRG